MTRRIFHTMQIALAYFLVAIVGSTLERDEDSKGDYLRLIELLARHVLTDRDTQPPNG